MKLNDSDKHIPTHSITSYTHHTYIYSMPNHYYHHMNMNVNIFDINLKIKQNVWRYYKNRLNGFYSFSLKPLHCLTVRCV